MKADRTLVRMAGVYGVPLMGYLPAVELEEVPELTRYSVVRNCTRTLWIVERLNIHLMPIASRYRIPTFRYSASLRTQNLNLACTYCAELYLSAMGAKSVIYLLGRLW